jgi:hypothetical protein
MEAGKVDPWLCPHDHSPLGSILGKDEQPRLKCYLCLAVFDPGSDMYAKIAEALDAIR